MIPLGSRVAPSATETTNELFRQLKSELQLASVAGGGSHTIQQEGIADGDVEQEPEDEPPPRLARPSRGVVCPQLITEINTSHPLVVRVDGAGHSHLH